MTETLALAITDGSTTVTFTSIGYVNNYIPRNEIASNPWVVETIEVTMTGTTSYNKSRLEAVDRLLNQAERYWNDGVYPIVYITRQTDTTQNSWRSPVKMGLCTLGPNTFDLEHLQAKQVMILTYTRANYWEDDEAEVSIENEHTSGTGGIQVDNPCLSGSSPAVSNYVDVAAASIAGDINAATRITIEKAGAGSSWGELVMGVNQLEDANLTIILQGESAGSVSSIADTASSNNLYGRYTFVGTGEYPSFYWTLSTTFLNSARGRLFLPIIRASGGGSTFYGDTRLGLGYATSGNWVYLSPKVYMDLGNKQLGLFPPMRILPVPINPTALADIYLVLRQTGTLSAQHGIDYLMLLPLDSYRRLSFPYTTVATGDIVVDSGPDNTAYITTSGENKPITNKSDTPIFLRANKKNRIYFYWQYQSAGEYYHQFDDYATVRVYLRARRLTLN